MRVVLLVELRKAETIGGGGRLLVTRERTELESAETLEHVQRPADALAELAVADDVDARLDLEADDRVDRVPEAPLVGSVVVGFPALDRAYEREQLAWPNQAAHVRRRDPGVCAHLSVTNRVVGGRRL